MQNYLNSPPMNPLTRFFAAVAGAVVLTGALFFGLFIFLGSLALGLIAWISLWVRAWWLGRSGVTSHSDAEGHPRAGGAERSVEVIEAEYTVVSRRED